MKKWSNKQSQQPERQKATDPMVALLIKKLSTHIDIACLFHLNFPFNCSPSDKLFQINHPVSLGSFREIVGNQYDCLTLLASQIQQLVKSSLSPLGVQCSRRFIR